MAAVIHATPSLDALPASTPRSIRGLIERCIAERPFQPAHSMGVPEDE
jgi:hypothetical protein